MRRRDLETLFDFSYWMRDRVLEHAAKLTPAEFRAPSGVTTRDLRRTLEHTLDVEWSWRARLQGQPEEVWKRDLSIKDFPTCVSLVEHWRRDEAEMRAWLASLDDERLEAIFELPSSTAMAT